MHYVVSEENIGPNQTDRLNSRRYNIQTKPRRTNMSGEERTDGWLGCTGDWDRHAHGEFDTQAAALAKIEELTDGDYREAEIEPGDGDEEYGHGVMASYLAGEYEDWDAETSINWCSGGGDEIDATTSTERINALVREWAVTAVRECDANLDVDAVREWLTERRDELKAEVVD